MFPLDKTPVMMRSQQGLITKHVVRGDPWSYYPDTDRRPSCGLPIQNTSLTCYVFDERPIKAFDILEKWPTTEHVWDIPWTTILTTYDS